MDKEKKNVNQVEQIKAEIDTLNLDVPEDILKKIEDQVKLQESQEKISPLGLSRELFSIAPELKTKMRVSIFFACIGELFSFSSYFFSAYAVTWILDFANGKEVSFDKLFTYAIYAIIALVFSLILTGISTIISHRTAFKILSKLRVGLFEKLKEIPMGYLVENSVGKTKVLIQDKVAEIEDWVAHIMPEMPSRLLGPIVSTIILFYIDWRIGLSIFAPLPFVVIGSMSMMNKYRARNMVWACSYSNVADRSTEYVRGIPVIKAFLQGKKSYKHFSDAVNFYHSSTLEWWKQSWFGMSISMAAMMTPLLLTLPLAIYLYTIGQLEMFELILSIVLPLSILPQAFPISQSLEIFASASTTWLLIRELLFKEKQIRPDENKVADLDSRKGIEFRNVSFSYKEGEEVLKDINFTADIGKVTAIVGPSGSGKSTIAKLISGYWDVNSGQIMLGDVDVKDISFKQLMEQISYVSQDNYLFDTSIEENIRMACPSASHEQVVEAAKATNCHDFIMSLKDGYQTRVGDAGDKLSGGEKQRITLARAMLKPSRIVILDEATAYADPENEFEIQQAISRLVEDKSLIVIAHRLYTIKSADKIIVMSKGQIDSIGRHDELMKNSEVYQNLNKNN